jgi:hypothetical protein
MAVTQLNIVGSGFSDSGTITIYVSASGESTQYTATTSSSGDISYTIQLSSIAGIATATTLLIYAVDGITNVSSNTISIPITVVTPPSIGTISVIVTGYSASISFDSLVPATGGVQGATITSETINWGDGSAVQTIQNGDIGAAYNYSVAGTYTITVTITNSLGGSSTGTATAVITQPATIPTWSCGGVQGQPQGVCNVLGNVGYQTMPTEPSIDFYIPGDSGLGMQSIQSNGTSLQYNLIWGYYTGSSFYTSSASIQFPVNYSIVSQATSAMTYNNNQVYGAYSGFLSVIAAANNYISAQSGVPVPVLNLTGNWTIVQGGTYNPNNYSPNYIPSPNYQEYIIAVDIPNMTATFFTGGEGTTAQGWVSVVSAIQASTNLAQITANLNSIGISGPIAGNGYNWFYLGNTSYPFTYVSPSAFS